MDHRFERALQGAVEDGVLTRQQAEEVRRRASVHEDRSDRTVRLVSWIGATFVAVGIILLVATNWQDIRGARTMLLAAATAAALGGGWRLLAKGHAPTGHALLVIGGAALGGTLFQVADWANLPPDNPLLLGLWFLGLMAVAYPSKSAPVLLEALLVLPFWLGFTVVGDSEPAFHTVMLLFATTGLAVAGASAFHGHRLPGFRPLLLGFGTAGVLLVAFVATFTAGEIRFAMRWSLREILWLVGASLVAVGGFMRLARTGSRWSVAPHGILVAMVLLAGFGTGEALVNVVFAALLVGLVVAAVQARSELVLNIALTAFVVEIVGRYFDFVFDENLDASLFFIGGGLLLLGAAYGADKVRRRLRPGPVTGHA